MDLNSVSVGQNMIPVKESKYDPKTSMYFCYQLTVLFMLVQKNFKSFDGKKSLNTVFTSPLKQNVFWHAQMSRCLKKKKVASENRKNN